MIPLRQRRGEAAEGVLWRLFVDVLGVPGKGSAGGASIEFLPDELEEVQTSCAASVGSIRSLVRGRVVRATVSDRVNEIPDATKRRGQKAGVMWGVGLNEP